MKISFLVPTLGERQYELERLLASLELQENMNFEVIIIAQRNQNTVKCICAKFSKLLITIIEIQTEGLSYARNVGLAMTNGDIIVLSDDDCWYPPWASDYINSQFSDYPHLDVLFTQIFDEENHKYYKNYSSRARIVKSKYEIMSKSSIEISFKKAMVSSGFDENFGLGARFQACEEVDFLLSNYKSSSCYMYLPRIIVYHKSKCNNAKYSSKHMNGIIAKGALYSKHSNIVIGFIVAMRDIISKGEYNLRFFCKGYSEYKKIKKI